MFTKMKIYKIGKIMAMICCILIRASVAFSDLKLDFVYPTIGEVAQDLKVTLTGAGFDENTSIIMYPDVGNKRTIIASVPTTGAAWGITVSGTTAYVADSTGLKIIDMSDPENPLIIGSLDTPGRANDVAVQGATAYVADRESGLQIADISDPKNPRISFSVETDGEANGVAVADTYVYVADGDKGLQVIFADTSDLSMSQETGRVETSGYANDVTVSGETAYVADGLEGLLLINVSNPENPEIIGSADTPGYANAVTLSSDSLVYVADRWSGLQIIDVSDSGHPEIIGSADTPGDAYDIKLSGTTAYIADRDKGVQVIDVTDLTNPVIMGSVDIQGQTFGIALSGTTAFAVGWDYEGYSGLQLIDTNDVSSDISLVGSLETPGYAFDIAVSDTTAFIADYDQGLQIADVSDPENPRIIGKWDTQGNVYGVTMSENKAYAACGGYGRWKGLEIVDVSNPENPVISGSLETSGNTFDIAVSGTKAYLACYSHLDGYSELKIADVSDPENPTFDGFVKTPGRAYAVSVSGTTAFVADYDRGLQVIDVSDPQNPEIIAFADMPGLAYGVTVSETTAYVADYDEGLQVIDVRDPEYPEIIGFADTPGLARSVTVSGATAYVADGHSSLQVINISEPANPVIVFSAETKGCVESAAISGSTGFLADGYSGLRIVSLPVKLDHNHITVENETSISFTLPAPGIAGHQTLKVYNENGSYDIPGAITFFNEKDFQNQERRKALIVGARNSPDDDLWPHTKLSLQFANEGLRSLGYTDERIQILRPDKLTDADGITRIRDKITWTFHQVPLLKHNGVRFSNVEVISSSIPNTPYESYVSWICQALVADYGTADDGIDDTVSSADAITLADAIKIMKFQAGVIDAEGDDIADKATLKHAITEWAATDTDELLIHMVGHGERDTFTLNENETLTAEEMDGWLDDFQEKTNARVILIYDASYSGSFIPLLTPPDGKERIVITTSAENEPAFFGSDTADSSFSGWFWFLIFVDSNINNLNLYALFAQAQGMVKIHQTPHLDANGDGIGYLEAGLDEADVMIAREIFLGRAAANSR